MDMNGWTPGITLESWEKLAIEAAFHFYRGNKTQTSIALGIAIRTLDAKLEKYELDRRAERERYERDKRERARIAERMRGVTADQVVEAGRSSLYGADTGVHLESPTFTGQEHSVSMPERQEVQAVLPPQSAKGNSGGASQSIQNSNGKGKPRIPDKG
jgi:hypothetical protein